MRSATSLIQTIGRAARNVSGQVHMYADVVTDSMRKLLMKLSVVVKYRLLITRNMVLILSLCVKIADVTDMLARENADTKSVN